jgi:hypothetical protein
LAHFIYLSCYKKKQKNNYGNSGILGFSLKIFVYAL